ncbi:MAG TPA: iron-sulfur cluster repair di-iron protein [Bacteroidetes bacterium]|nr:iron-sulfur cluster repair di-iron protein [Bacteroidota bacterium]
MKIQESNIIGELVADDYRTAAIFKQYGIDFCCNGNRSIQEACAKKKIDVELVLENLVVATTSQDNSNTDYQSWPLDALVDHIVKTHHHYVESTTQQLLPYLNKLCRVHGERHPELHEIAAHFNAAAGALAQHMKKEELILFPFIQKMVHARQNKLGLNAPHFGTVENPVRMMMLEHDTEGDRFRQISDLTDGYTPPADACNTYRVTFALLKAFEADLHLHIHLENNILFPKAIEMEKEFSLV